MGFEIIDPIFLNLFFLFPLVIFIHLISLKLGRKRALNFANIKAIESVRGVEIFSKNLTTLYIFLFILALFIFSLAGAGYSFERETLSFSFVIAIDTSSSMAAKDIPPDRFSAAKDAAKNFIDLMPLGTEIGIVSFSGIAVVESELSQDKALLKRVIDTIAIGEVGGTNILDAVEKSKEVLDKRNARAIILLSDGQITVNKIPDVIDYAERNSLLISSLGIGTVEGGEAGVFISKLDEDALKSLAFNTDGNYYPVENRDELQNAFSDISTNTNKTVFIEFRNYLILSGLILLVLWWFLVNTRFRGIP